MPRGGVGGGKNWESRIRRCKLLYIGWINNKILLYSTGNYIQYPVIHHNGKEYEEEYICVTESLCRTAEIKTMKYPTHLSERQKSGALTTNAGEVVEQQKLLIHS